MQDKYAHMYSKDGAVSFSKNVVRWTNSQTGDEETEAVSFDKFSDATVGFTGERDLSDVDRTFFHLEGVKSLLQISLWTIIKYVVAEFRRDDAFCVRKEHIAQFLFEKLGSTFDYYRVILRWLDQLPAWFSWYDVSVSSQQPAILWDCQMKRREKLLTCGEAELPEVMLRQWDTNACSSCRKGTYFPGHQHLRDFVIRIGKSKKRYGDRCEWTYVENVEKLLVGCFCSRECSNNWKKQALFFRDPAQDFPILYVEKMKGLNLPDSVATWEEKLYQSMDDEIIEFL